MTSSLLDDLRATLAERPPFCSGTLELSEQDFELYYGKKQAGYVDLCETSFESSNALKALAEACETARFGRNAETVLDETYRKAGKMDAENFMLRLDVERSGLLNVVHSGLLSGKDEKRLTRSELYKLNVYGEGAFFKPHRDTPKGDDMFGSLVVIFPTPHEGGTLVLRHEGQEWSIDAAALLGTESGSRKPTIVYAAFFSDVEHEILPVVSGYRVSTTYNLYWGRRDLDMRPDGLTMLQPAHSNTARVRDAFAALLDNPEFLPEGGTLAFGLRHSYPFPREWQFSDGNPLKKLENGWLKGGDWALYCACKELGLIPLLRLVQSYNDGLVILMDKMLDWAEDMIENAEERELLEQGGVAAMRAEFGESTKDIEKRVSRGSSEYDVDIKKVVYWVTEGNSGVQSGAYITYGNEATIPYLYMMLHLVVYVGPPGRRLEKEDDDD